MYKGILKCGWAALGLLLALGWAAPSAAAGQQGQAPGGHLRITEVYVDVAVDKIEITGEGFDFGAPL